MGTCGFQKVVTSKNYIEQEGKGGLDELSTAVINHSYSWYGTLLDGLLVALGCKAPFTYAVIVHAKQSPVHSSGRGHRPSYCQIDVVARKRERDHSAGDPDYYPRRSGWIKYPAVRIYQR